MVRDVVRSLPVVALVLTASGLAACSGSSGLPGTQASAEGGGGTGSSSGGGSSGASGSSSGGGHGSSSSSGSSGGSPGGSSSGGATGSSSGTSSGSSSGSTGSSSGSSSGSNGDAGGAVWSPSSGAPVHFHWQLSDTFTSADLIAGEQGQVVYDIDGEGATAADVAAIHAAGAKAVCYVDVGSLEKGRSDYAQFPASVVGPVMQGWPDENWLMVTAANQPTILPLMKARFENWCLAKGFDAIEPDNIDAFSNVSGITQADNVAYDLAIAQLAHGMSLSIGMKNLLPDLDASYLPGAIAAFDWALVEQCYEYTECDGYGQAGSFIPQGKAVFDVEYDVAPTCSAANAAHMNAQKRDLDLTGPGASGYTYSPCIPDTQSTW